MQTPSTVTHDRKLRELEAYGFVFEKADRIVSGEPVDVDMTMRPPINLHRVAGWTDGQQITLNANVLQERLDESENRQRALAFVKGVNYHELAHVMFTPRLQYDDYSLANMVRKRGERDGNTQRLWMAFNILEDQRAETLFVARFQASRHFFQAIALEYLLNDPAVARQQYPLVHHRLWIPEKTRKGLAVAYDTYIGVDGRAQEIGDVIDEYVKLVFPQNRRKGLTLIERFARLLYEDPLAERVKPESHFDGVLGVPMNRGSVNEGEQADASSKIDVMISDLERGQEESEDREDGGGSSGDLEEALESAHEALEELYGDDSFLEDIKRTNDAIEAALKGAGIGSARGIQNRASSKAVHTRDQTVVRRIIDELYELRVALDSSWERGRPYGKINPRKFMTSFANDPGDLDFFDRWEESVQDKADFEMVILVDYSSSMSAETMKRACRSAWILKRALEDESVDGRVTVLGYTSGTPMVIYDPEDKALSTHYRYIHPTGGTYPDEAVSEAFRLFDRSQRSNKVLVSLTDGAWGGNPDPYIKTMGDMGIHTVLIGLAEAVKANGTHEHQIATDIDSVLELPGVVAQVVADILMRLALRN